MALTRRLIDSLRAGYVMDRWSLRKPTLNTSSYQKSQSNKRKSSPSTKRTNRITKPVKKVVTKKMTKKTFTEIQEEQVKKKEVPTSTYALLPKVYGLVTLDGNVIWKADPTYYELWYNDGGSYVRNKLVLFMVEVAFAQDSRCVRYKRPNDYNSYFPDPELPVLWNFKGFVDFNSGILNPWLYYYDTWYSEHLADYWVKYVFPIDPPAKYGVTQKHYFFHVRKEPLFTMISDLSKPGETIQGNDWSSFNDTEIINQPAYTNYNKFLSGGWDSYGNPIVKSPGVGMPPPYNPNIGIYASRHPSVTKASFLQVIWETEFDNQLPKYSANICVNLWKDMNVEVKDGCWYKEAILDLIRISGNEWTDYKKSEWGIDDDEDDNRYFINKAFTDQITIRNAIEEICEQVGVICYFDLDAGRFKLKKAVETEYISAATFDATEVDLNIVLETDKDIYSTYKGHYREYEKETFNGEVMKTVNFTKEAAVVDNDLNRRIVGLRRTESDFEQYYNAAQVKARMSEVIKQESWIKHYGTAVTSLRYIRLKPGMVITARDTEQLKADILMKITKMSVGDASISFDLEQVTPITSFYSEGGGGEPGFGPAVIPVVDDFEVVQLPHTGRFGFQQMFYVKINPSVALKNYFENNASENYRIMLYASDTETGDYSFYKYISEYSSYWKHINAWSTGLESELTTFPGKAYASDNYEIRIDFTDNLPEQVSPLLVKIDDEWILAKSWTTKPLFPDSIFLNEYSRGQLGTEKADHSSGSVATVLRLWSTTGANTEYFGYTNNDLPLTYQNLSDLEGKWIKPIVVMENGLKISSIDDTDPIQVVPATVTPWKPIYVKAVRSGANVMLSWHFRSPQAVYSGASSRTVQNIVPHDTPLYTGIFEVSVNGGGYINPGGYTYVVNDASSFTFSLRQKESAVSGPAVTYTIGTTDGTYINGVLV